jgi:prepilin-type N-terminal cleavage/methylation domain-containing protein
MLKNKKGFTILEGLVVVVIIGICVAIWGFHGRDHMKISMMSEARMFIDKIVAQEKIYYANHGEFINTNNKSVNVLGTIFISAKSNKYFKTFKILTPEGKTNTLVVEVYPDTKTYKDLKNYYIRGIFVLGMDTVEYNEFFG